MRNLTTKLLLTATLSAVLMGCAGSSPRIDSQRLAAVHKGQTTLDQVVRQFGRPSVLLNNPDGTKTARYLHNDDVPGSTMVPLVSTATVDETTFYFDESGVLVDYKIVRPTPVATSPSNSVKNEAADAAKTSDKPVGGRAEASGKPATQNSGSWTLRGLLPEPTTQNR